MRQSTLDKQRGEIIKGKMKRVYKHKKVLNLILNDLRLSPHRRLLGEMLALWVDSEDKVEKDRILKLIEANYGSAKRTYFLEGDDPAEGKPSLGKVEAEATRQLKEFFSQVQEEAEELKQEVVDVKTSKEIDGAVFET